MSYRAAAYEQALKDIRAAIDDAAGKKPPHPADQYIQLDRLVTRIETIAALALKRD